MFVTKPDKGKVFEKIKEVSQNAELVFLGIDPPKIEKFLENKDAYVKEYADYYVSLLEKTEGFPPTAIILSAEDIKFSEIFK